MHQTGEKVHLTPEVAMYSKRSDNFQLQKCIWHSVLSHVGSNLKPTILMYNWNKYFLINRCHKCIIIVKNIIFLVTRTSCKYDNFLQQGISHFCFLIPMSYEEGRYFAIETSSMVIIALWDLLQIFQL